MRGMGCCKSCLNAAPRANCVQHIKQWALRICFTDLTHIALTGDKVEQLSQVNFMKNMFPELKQEPLEVLPYSELVTKTRNLFMHIGVSRQNRALQSFLARSLKFLTPTMVAGLSPDVRSQVVHFVDAVAEGKVLPHESKAIVLWQSLARCPFYFSLLLRRQNMFGLVILACFL